MKKKSPQAQYQLALQQGFKADPAQAQAVHLLEQCYRQLESQPQEKQPLEQGQAAQGVYLWGPVGRGKTWLMDCFYASLSIPARRQHFHHFMRWVHQRLFQLTGQENPLQLLATELARDVRVLCFDELFISDIGDAMLISGLFQALLEQGLVLVATSNQHPDQLYENGFNRERLLPALAAIKHHLQVLNVDGGEDHRLHPGEYKQRYWHNDRAGLQACFEHLSQGQSHQETPLRLNQRELQVVRRSSQLLWCTYTNLCEQPWATADFIRLCDQYQAIFISQIPQLSSHSAGLYIARGTEDGAVQVAAGERELFSTSRQDDGVRRFIALVDECYDRQVPLYLEAAVSMAELYPSGALSFPFQRTLSRLHAMQLARFGQNTHK